MDLKGKVQGWDWLVSSSRGRWCWLPTLMQRPVPLSLSCSECFGAKVLCPQPTLLPWPCAPARGLPGTNCFRVSCWLHCYHRLLWIISMAGLVSFYLLFTYLFFLSSLLVMRSFNFCLNFVCLSFSPRLVPCLSTLSCWLCLRCSFPAASSIHQVQAADLRRVSAPPGSFTMWVQCHSVLTLFPQLLLLRGRSPAASFSSTGLLLGWGAHPIIDAFRPPPFMWYGGAELFVLHMSPHPMHLPFHLFLRCFRAHACVGWSNSLCWASLFFRVW